MKEYNTSEIAKEFNIHPNTVRFYEDIGFLPQIPRIVISVKFFKWE